MMHAFKIQQAAMKSHTGLPDPPLWGGLGRG